MTYASFILDHKPFKAEPHRVYITVGGDRIPFEDDDGSPASNILETKVLINSIISDAFKGAKFMGADISDDFLDNPMKTAEFMKVKYNHIPDDIKHFYNLQD